MQQRLFAPLDMTSSDTSIRALVGRSDVAAPHESIDGKLRAIPYRNIDNIAPAGGINSNAIDMAHWMSMLLYGGTYGGRRLLQQSTVAEMFTPQTIMPLEFPWTLYARDGNGTVSGADVIEIVDYTPHGAPSPLAPPQPLAAPPEP